MYLRAKKNGKNKKNIICFEMQITQSAAVNLLSHDKYYTFTGFFTVYLHTLRLSDNT